MNPAFSRAAVKPTFMLGVIAVVLGLATNASASLIFDSTVDLSGTGIGNVVTVLTMQETGNRSAGDALPPATSSPDDESGCVGMTGSADQIGSAACADFPGFEGIGGDEGTGASQTLTRSLSELGVTTAEDFGIVFNANEPDDSILLEDMCASFFTSAGALLYTACLGEESILFGGSFGGTGSSGALFVLDAAQILEATLAGAFSSATNRVGVAGLASSATGGFETFFGLLVNGTPPPPPDPAVPEPGSMVLLGSGLIGLAAAARRRMKR